jgi:hypothetical protein
MQKRMQSLSEEERRELDETLSDPKKSEGWANKVVDAWIARRQAMREREEKNRQKIARIIKDLESTLIRGIPRAAKRSKEALLDEFDAYQPVLDLKQKLGLQILRNCWIKLISFWN